MNTLQGISTDKVHNETEGEGHKGTMPINDLAAVRPSQSAILLPEIFDFSEAQNT